MKMVFILCFSLISLFKSFGQDTLMLKALKYEIDSFIVKVKPQSIKNGAYNVYIIKLRQDSLNDFCLSVNFIDNEFSFDRFVNEYYFKVNDEFIIVKCDTNYLTGIASFFKARPIDSISKELISKKLFPKSKGGITGTSMGLLICCQGGKIIKKFYPDSDEMPDDMQIYSMPEGMKVERIYPGPIPTSLKQK